MKLTARDILFKMSISDVFYQLTQKSYIVVYDDGTEEETTHKELIFNRYVWELFRLYPETPILPNCSIVRITRGGYYHADVHIRLLETTFRHIRAVNELVTFEQKESLIKRSYEIVNLIYNDLLNKIANKVCTIDAVDFIEVINMPEIKKIHADIKPHPDSIERAYRDIKYTLMNAKNSHNRFIHAYKSRAINENQSNQGIGPRGFISDLDRTVFKQPVMNGFIKGLGNLFEVIAESRTAAKALTATDTHIQTSEYTSRRLQLLTMPLEKVITMDCGSNEYFNMMVTQENIDNLRGKYYLDETDNMLKVISNSDTHLFNKMVKLRTSLGCRLHNPRHICSTCFGELAHNFREEGNLGYTAVAHLMKKSTQTILSTKHLTHSVRKTSISFEGNANKYFTIDKEDYVFFNKELDLKGLKLVLYANQVAKLVDALSVKNGNISMSKIGEIREISIIDTNHKIPTIDSVYINYKDRNSILTKISFEFIRNCANIETDARGNFIIPLDKFDKTHPVFYNPIKEKDIITFVNRLAQIIETNSTKSADSQTSTAKIVDPYEKLDVLFNHVSQQFRCNISILEAIVYCTTAFNLFNLDYRFGRNSPHSRTDSKSNIFKHRSMSQMLVFEDQVKVIFNNGVNIFSNEYRQGHPFDILFTPREKFQDPVQN